MLVIIEKDKLVGKRRKKTIKQFYAIMLSLVLLFAVSCESASSASSVTSSSLPPVEPTPPVESPYPFTDPLGINPLTGLARAEGMPEGQRPVAIMVANNQMALPQRGVSAADVVYETVTEGGITRLMAVYANFNTIPTVGPVRSIRDSFVQLALPSNAIPAYIGTSVYANNLLNVLEYQGLNGMYLGASTFGFDAERALPKEGGKPHEYCWFTDTSLLLAGIEQAAVFPTGTTPSLFAFADAGVSPGVDAYTVVLTYSAVSQPSFDFDETTLLYHKNIYGAPHADENGARLSFTNIIVLAADISIRADGFTTNFNFTKGNGYYFTAGIAQPITWEKGKPEEPLKLFQTNGEPLLVQRGKSYIGVVPTSEAQGVVFAPKPLEEPTTEAISPAPTAVESAPVAEELPVEQAIETQP